MNAKKLAAVLSMNESAPAGPQPLADEELGTVAGGHGHGYGYGHCHNRRTSGYRRRTSGFRRTTGWRKKSHCGRKSDYFRY